MLGCLTVMLDACTCEAAQSYIPVLVALRLLLDSALPSQDLSLQGSDPDRGVLRAVPDCQAQHSRLLQGPTCHRLWLNCNSHHAVAMSRYPRLIRHL